MARAPVEDRLRHMLEAIARIEERTAGKDLDAYAADWVTRDVVERNLERISEASRHIPQDLKARHAGVRCRAVAGIGDILRHDYPRVIDERIWQIVAGDLARLKLAIEAMLREVEG